MIPNLYIENGCFTKHPFINGCLGFQVSELKIYPVVRLNPGLPIVSNKAGGVHGVPGCRVSFYFQAIKIWQLESVQNPCETFIFEG